MSRQSAGKFLPSRVAEMGTGAVPSLPAGWGLDSLAPDLREAPKREELKMQQAEAEECCGKC